MRHCSRARRVLTIFCLLCSLLPLAQAGASPRTPGSAAGSVGITVRSHNPTDPAPALYIVQLEGAPLAAARVVLLGTRSAGARATSKPDFATRVARDYRAQLAIQRQRVLAQAQAVLGVALKPVATFDTAYNGMALELTGEQAALLASMPGVLSVRRDQTYRLTTDYGPTWIGANAIWDGSVTGVYAATILGANQAPPIASPLNGRGTLSFTAATNTLSYNITISGFAGANPITAAHIYRATDGSVVADLSAAAAPGVYSGSTVLPAGDVTLLKSDKLYVNVRTAAHPNGELKGTISGYKGEGVVVGIIDTGINTKHPSFAAVGGDGYHHVNPLGAGKYKGACDPANLPSRADGNPSGYNPAITCNDKLIGAWTFTGTYETDSPVGEPSPNDDDGHGSHTASTVAGNVILNATINGATFPRISGVAPHANIIAYDACCVSDYSGLLWGAPLIAAVEQATKDGVDVINFSISGGTDPWNDDVELAFAAAREAGIVVVTAAGNDGPNAGKVAHAGPWLLATAASTHNRTLTSFVTNIASSDGSTLLDIKGLGLTGPLSTSTPLVYGGAMNNPYCTPFTASQKLLVAGKIIICDVKLFVGDVSQNVKDASGIGIIYALPDPTDHLFAFPFVVPGVNITFADGNTLKAWVAAHPNPTARISGYITDLNPANGDILATFSSRGPSAIEGILKPDIAAPGVDIVAANANSGGPQPDYAIKKGTSMASPHVAGSAALLVGLHPDWTPGAVQSALMTTTKPQITKSDSSGPTTPFESGAGRVQVNQAAMAGLILDERGENFRAANPQFGGNPRTLNIPSMAATGCVLTCSWTRRLTSALDAPATWTASTSAASITVSPSTFTLAPGESKTVTISFDPHGAPLDGSYVFGRVTFHTGGGAAPDAHLPLAVSAVASTMLTEESLRMNTGVFTKQLPIDVIGYSNLKTTTYDMVKAEIATPTLPQTDNYVTKLEVPSGTARIVAEVLASSSWNVLMDVYADSDASGTLDRFKDTNICTRWEATARKYCNIVGPAAGTYFVRVANGSPSSLGAYDAIKFATAIVPKSASGNLTVSAPTSYAGGSLNLTLHVNMPTSQLGDVWYGWYDLSDTAAPRDLGSTSLNFYHVVGPPASAAAATGTPQSALVGTLFPSPLTVVVKDSLGNAVSSAQVTFSAPATGARAVFPAGATATTNDSGVAAVPVRAGLTPGSYTVTASVGDASTSFVLTNLPHRTYLPLAKK